MQSDDDFQRLKKQLPEDTDLVNLGLNINSRASDNFFGKLGTLYRKLFMDPRYFNMIGFSAIVILGGDDLSEYYKGWKVATDLLRIKKYSKKMPVYLVGQTIGPFKSWRVGYAKKCFKKVNIYFRDKLSMDNYQQNIKSGSTMLGADLAVLELPNIVTGFDILERLHLKENMFITIVPSGFSELYTSDKENYIKSWKNILNNLLENDSLKDKKFLLLSHVTWPEDDRTVIKAIINGTADISERIVFENIEYTPEIARYLIGRSYFIITGRMHPAVSAFQQNKPAITMAYSMKFFGVIGEAFGLKDLIVDCDKDSEWTNSDIADELNNKVDLLIENYSQLLEIISKNREIQIQLAQKQINDIADKINI
jgi:colanic acid/amylovoran biosynthesis protein